MNVENMDIGVPPQQTPESGNIEDRGRQEPEKGHEDLGSVLEEIERDFSDLQHQTENMSTVDEGYEIINKLEGLYDKNLNLSNEVGYQPITGRNKFATPTAISNERKIEPQRNRIHGFLMDVAWEKYEKFKGQQ